jgi:hypothetical protein
MTSGEYRDQACIADEYTAAEFEAQQQPRNQHKIGAQSERLFRIPQIPMAVSSQSVHIWFTLGSIRFTFGLNLVHNPDSDPQNRANGNGRP